MSSPDSHIQPTMLRQPDSRPISHDQLAAEVKSIYAGLSMVEAKCIEVDKLEALALREPRSPKAPLPTESWQALIALHRTLLHEHHDFLLASQHPSASPALRRLAAKYSMPARMWKHGIHSFLEILRHRLPDSLDYMLAYIYLAYQMMALLYETVPAFEETWIECLGDIGRYRMAIEDDDARDRDTWAGVARSWYLKAADRSPYVGRLYHHLAILARPFQFQQLYYYSLSLVCVQPFPSARKSVLTVFDGNFGCTMPGYSKNHRDKTAALYVKLVGILFQRQKMEAFDATLRQFLNVLGEHIGSVTSLFIHQGVQIAVTNIASLFNYGSEESNLRKCYDHYASARSLPATDTASSQKAPAQNTFSIGYSDFAAEIIFPEACRLSFLTFSLVLRRSGDNNVLPMVHIMLAFLFSLSVMDYDLAYLADRVPWEELVSFLNTLSKVTKPRPQIENASFLEDEVRAQDFRPLPEDNSIRGQVWTQWYFPDSWFARNVDEDERLIERESTVVQRTERILWLGVRIAQTGRWIAYDQRTRSWSVLPAFAQARDCRLSSEGSRLSRELVKNEEEDVPMVDSEEAEMAWEPTVTESDSAEMRKLREIRHGLLHSEKTSLQISTPPTPSDARGSMARKMLQRNFTVLVCDTNLLIKRLDVFQMLLHQHEWSVVVPNSVVTELHGLAKNKDQSGFAAEKAIETISLARNQRMNIRILTAKGNDITNQGFYKEQIEESERGTRRKLDEVIIDITRQQSDISNRSTAMQNQRAMQEGAKPAVLVTEDQLMRVKAWADGVAAVDPSIVKDVIFPAQGASPGPPQLGKK
ncbi:hypothetical protein BDY21DRAFT_287627 [Lineolata rhizophorae]|uniref:PIN domain-containing protein n=1 Tax=Lineolata rhizophorae TaxID=578093 RepID=A0A6A6NXJ1_9PEZI|nr:hypothetical protein BDY21DRAFT_287627 [Lineolata rhizophorae]